MRKFLIAILAVALATVGCVEKPIVLPWEPVTPVDPEPGSDPAVSFKGKPRYVWIDASANFQYYANSVDNINADMKRIKECGFTDVVVDVRPTEGCVLFNSKIAPKAVKLAAWVRNSSGGSSYQFVQRTAGFDYLQAFIDAGHEVGLRVNAAMNTFVCGYGGYYGLESVGPVFTGAVPAEWATMDVDASGSIVSTYSPKVAGTVFMNPARDDVQDYLLNLIGELAEYDLDGIVLDRCRFDDNGLLSEYSNETKAKFGEYLGSSPSKWPVFTREELPSSLSAEQKSWLAFRAKVIHDFVESAAKKVHAKNSKMRFACYVGAWYSTYYTSGVNWASPKFNTASYFPAWANSDYKSFGYADHCDFMLLGCYASTSGIYGNGEWTMQGFCKQAKTLLCGDTEFAGGPDVGNPTGWPEGGQGSKIPQTIDACINSGDGYFVFDLCHIRMYDYWSAFKKGFDDYINNL